MLLTIIRAASFHTEQGSVHTTMPSKTSLSIRTISALQPLATVLFIFGNLTNNVCLSILKRDLQWFIPIFSLPIKTIDSFVVPAIYMPHCPFSGKGHQVIGFLSGKSWDVRICHVPGVPITVIQWLNRLLFNIEPWLLERSQQIHTRMFVVTVSASIIKHSFSAFVVETWFCLPMRNHSWFQTSSPDPVLIAFPIYSYRHPSIKRSLTIFQWVSPSLNKVILLFREVTMGVSSCMSWWQGSYYKCCVIQKVREYRIDISMLGIYCLPCLSSPWNKCSICDSKKFCLLINLHWHLHLARHILLVPPASLLVAQLFVAIPQK